jgi:aminocarboxymuconate-semialdehyde decarboxylase
VIARRDAGAPAVIDVHTHFVPPSLEAEAAKHSAWGVAVEHGDQGATVVHAEGFRWPLDDAFGDVGVRLDDMDRRRIDHSVLSLPPTLFHYWIDSREASALARWANDSLAEMVRDGGGRLSGLASLPMQDPQAAAAELRRCVEELGLAGAHVGTRVEDRTLDDPDFDPVWEAAAQLGVPVVLHPYYVGARPGFEDYYLTNLLLNPIDTTLAAARLILSGTAARFPEVAFVLVHGGGFLPYQVGRLDHGWRVRPETRLRLETLPSDELGRFYFDTVTHGDSALAWLVELVGADRVMLGSDLPFDMADADPVGRLERSVPDERERRRIACDNARELFGLAAVPTATVADEASGGGR